MKVIIRSLAREYLMILLDNYLFKKLLLCQALCQVLKDSKCGKETKEKFAEETYITLCSTHFSIYKSLSD